MNRKILIVGSSKLPIPAVLGGAVPNLIEEIISENESQQKFDLYCCSLYHHEAGKQAQNKYPHSHFIWLNPPCFIQWLDNLVYGTIKHVFRIKRLHSLRSIFQTLWLQKSIANILHTGIYDMVIFENSIPLLAALKFYNNYQKYKNKYMIHMHSVPRQYYGNAHLFSDSKKIICVSQYVADQISSDRRLAVSKEKTVVMYNCVNTQLFRPTIPNRKVPARWGINVDEKIVLFAGRLCSEKGIEETINAFALLKTPHTHLLIIGSNFYKSDIVSPYEKKLRQLAKPFSKRIHFTGYIPYAKMPSVYQIADVVVLPSMWEEPAGMTILEAMSCKRPLISTYAGGIPEYTGEGNCILLKRNENLPKELAKYIDLLLTDQSLVKTLAEKSAKRASKYTEKYYYQQFVEILTDKEHACVTK